MVVVGNVTIVLVGGEVVITTTPCDWSDLKVIFTQSLNEELHDLLSTVREPPHQRDKFALLKPAKASTRSGKDIIDRTTKW